VREIRTLRVMWRELETELRSFLSAIAPVPDPTRAGNGNHAAPDKLLGGRCGMTRFLRTTVLSGVYCRITELRLCLVCALLGI
jgi:hypothetical protein